ncbi:reverse transcriptase (RNA-dependent DNA polymerase) [Leptospira meyeri]|uniref:Reverse transcriptase (RNA-dependent DNA polymerase) n=1 Tax=Leptospira meyeri TaxID=29508 RepID=A0A4R8MJ36_LEPME|nr:reverse transcriptase/maturase family protein [Leptospira meyeri]EKJ86165.1 RNA-directed DNA polymerase [Leptospira meyeri serovar Hardjo str. Went 5]TDY66512.1 reverse transcriptase (RNA-dependent DNA polymerase) [Leptospira meyeri]
MNSFNNSNDNSVSLTLWELLLKVKLEVNSTGILKSNPLEHLNIGIIYELSRRLKRNSASQKMELIDWQKNPKLANELASKISNNKYEFGIARQTTIQSNGKDRIIYSYRLEDKIVQKIISLVLNEIFDHEFFSESFAYRPNMSIQAGMRLIDQQYQEEKYCLKLDIHKCFNNIDNLKLIQILESKIKHPHFLKIIKKSLNTYTKSDGKKVKHSGIPQGSVHAPILANIYLHHCLDKPLRETYPDIKFYRYADDLLLTTIKEDTNNQINNWIENTLRSQNLSISEKTPNISLELKNGQKFLGYKVRKEQERLVIDIDQSKIIQKILEIGLNTPKHLNNYLRSQLKSTSISKDTHRSWYYMLVELPTLIRRELSTKVKPSSLDTILHEIDSASKPLLRELSSQLLEHQIN